jgi:hypothetical protein
VIADDEERQQERGTDEEQLDMPRRSPRNTETLVSCNTPTPGFDSVKIHHEPELQGGFKALRDKGLRITNYQEDIPK